MKKIVLAIASVALALSLVSCASTKAEDEVIEAPEGMEAQEDDRV